MFESNPIKIKSIEYPENPKHGETSEPVDKVRVAVEAQLKYLISRHQQVSQFTVLMDLLDDSVEIRLILAK